MGLFDNPLLVKKVNSDYNISQESGGFSSATQGYESAYSKKENIVIQGELARGHSGNRRREVVVEEKIPIKDKTGRIVAMEGNVVTYEGYESQIEQQKELRKLQKQGYDTSNIYFSQQGGGMSIAPSVVEFQRENAGKIFIDEKGNRFSANPDVVITNSEYKGFGLRENTYATGRKETIRTNELEVYGSQVSPDLADRKFYLSKELTKLQEGYVGNSKSSFLVPETTQRTPLGLATETIHYSELGLLSVPAFYYSLSPLGIEGGNANWRIPPIITAVAGGFAFGLAPLEEFYGGQLKTFFKQDIAKGFIPYGVKQADVVQTFENIESYGIAGGGVSNVAVVGRTVGDYVQENPMRVPALVISAVTFPALVEKTKDIATFIKVKTINPVLDTINPYAIKGSYEPYAERFRAINYVDVANVPNVGEMIFKNTPSQFARLNVLETYTGEEYYIAHATNRNPFRKNILSPVRNEFIVEAQAGSNKARNLVGGIEQGLFFSLPEIGRLRVQAYTYYLGSGGLSDILQGSARLSLFSRNRILLQKSLITPYSENLLNVARKGSLSPFNIRDLSKLQFFAEQENVAGTVRGGFAGAFGYRPELESIEAIGSVSKRTVKTLRGRLFKQFGLGDYYVRLSNGKKLELVFQEVKPMKLQTLSNVLSRPSIGLFDSKKASFKWFNKNIADVDRAFIESNKDVQIQYIKDVSSAQRTIIRQQATHEVDLFEISLIPKKQSLSPKVRESFIDQRYDALLREYSVGFKQESPSGSLYQKIMGSVASPVEYYPSVELPVYSPYSDISKVGGIFGLTSSKVSKSPVSRYSLVSVASFSSVSPFVSSVSSPVSSPISGSSVRSGKSRGVSSPMSSVSLPVSVVSSPSSRKSGVSSFVSYKPSSRRSFFSGYPSSFSSIFNSSKSSKTKIPSFRPSRLTFKVPKNDYFRYDIVASLPEVFSYEARTGKESYYPKKTKKTRRLFESQVFGLGNFDVPIRLNRGGY